MNLEDLLAQVPLMPPDPDLDRRVGSARAVDDPLIPILASLPLRAPSADLDQRIAQGMRPRPPRRRLAWVVALAASLLATWVTILMVRNQCRRPITQPANPQPVRLVDAPPPASAKQTPVPSIDRDLPRMPPGWTTSIARLRSVAEPVYRPRPHRDGLESFQRILEVCVLDSRNPSTGDRLLIQVPTCRIIYRHHPID